jgi:dTDP-4-amino-4,6-dideoxygalactose transaminase
MEIRVADLPSCYPEELQALRLAFERVLGHGQFILGEEVARFERAVESYLGVPHAIGVSSGTDALVLSLMALGIGPGDEVICPAFTFVATAQAIALLGAKPVFADVYPCCCTLAVEEVARKINSKTRAIIVVHLFGQPARMDALMELAQRHDLYLIEDAAQAFGASFENRKVGTLGILGCYSFYPTKNLAALGDAGLVVTRDEKLAEKIRALRVHGSTEAQKYRWVGGNFRLDALQAAWLTCRLERIEAKLAARKRNAERYCEKLLAWEAAEEAPSVCRGRPWSPLGKLLRLPPVCRNFHSWNQFVIQVPCQLGRDWVRASLAQAGVQTAVYYSLPLHLQECFASLGFREEELPVAEELSCRSLALPIHPGLRLEEVDFVAEKLAGLVRGAFLGKDG